ncbi:MAG: OmpA family protein [Myxococcales bacterium]|nr:OmpA family protein [Myxococcales bacterium]
MRSAAIAVLVAGLTLTGCKKDELEAALAEAQAQLEDTKNKLSAEEAKNKKLREENESLQARIAELEQEVKNLNDQLEQLAKDANITKKELDELRAEKAKRLAELQVYRDLFAKLKALVDAGTIKLQFRRGRVVVKMASEVLFDSGKAELKEEAHEALTTVASALAAVPDRDFLAAGYTDNVPIKTARFKSNWELSTGRAIEVVKFLIANGMPADRIGAAGFGENDPVGDNSTDEGRAQNRRIEIILMPKLGNIPGLKEMLMGS